LVERTVSLLVSNCGEVLEHSFNSYFALLSLNLGSLRWANIVGQILVVSPDCLIKGEEVWTLVVVELSELDVVLEDLGEAS
jgi:hypothetical protein